MDSQWSICAFCGKTKILDRVVVDRLMEAGQSETDAKAYARRCQYLVCFPEHLYSKMKPPFQHGAYYHGHCRNARVARYNAETDRFIYMRTKFGSTFAEDICHEGNDNGYDLFQPYGIMQNPPFEIPLVA